MIYQKVIEYCQKNNLSINAFEKMCGIGNGTVGRWKDGCSTPTLSTLKKIADRTKTSINKWIE